MAWQPAKNPYVNNRQTKQQMQNTQEEEIEIKGYCDLYESNPEYSTAMYGTVTIPLQLISDAVDAGEIKEIKGQECVVLSLNLYEFNGDWKFETAPPLLKGNVRRRSQKNGGRSKPSGQRRRF